MDKISWTENRWIQCAVILEIVRRMRHEARGSRGRAGIVRSRARLVVGRESVIVMVYPDAAKSAFDEFSACCSKDRSGPKAYSPNVCFSASRKPATGRCATVADRPTAAIREAADSSHSMAPSGLIPDRAGRRGLAHRRRDVAMLE